VEPPFRDVTESHMNKKNSNYVGGGGAPTSISFNVSFGNFPKFSSNVNKTQPLNSPIGIKTGLELISSHKKHQYESKENFIQFNSGSPLR
jgi:hypothetical protein